MYVFIMTLLKLFPPYVGMSHLCGVVCLLGDCMDIFIEVSITTSSTKLLQHDMS